MLYVISLVWLTACWQITMQGPKPYNPSRVLLHRRACITTQVFARWQAGLGLGVEQMTSLEFLRSYLCTAVASLPAAPRDAAFLCVLDDLPRLRGIDPAIVDELRKVWPWTKRLCFAC